MRSRRQYRSKKLPKDNRECIRKNYDDCWHGFTTEDARNVNSVTKGVAALLAGIIERATGEKCIDFANRNLFEPLGLPKRVLHGDSSKEDQFDFFMNKKPRKYEWYADPQDTVTAGWGLCMSERDMAVIGALVLNDGLFNGKRIISAEYLKDMTKPHLKLELIS